MIVFACSITDAAKYRRCAEPGIRLAAEPDSEVLASAAAGSIFRSYNLIMDTAPSAKTSRRSCCCTRTRRSRTPTSARTCARRSPTQTSASSAASEPSASARSRGGRARSTWASFTHRYEEFGGGELPGFSWIDNGDLPSYAETGEVETVDGFVLALSPWVVRNIRFDESLGQLHGYDFDFCLQVRAAGRKVATADFKVVHHHSLDLVSDPETWLAAHMRIAEKWEGRIPGVTPLAPDWRQRARRAEAEASLARTQAFAAMLHADRQVGPARAAARRDDRQHQLAHHRSAAPAQRDAQGAPVAMIAFGCAITEPRVFDRHAGPGIDAVAEPDSARFAFRATSSIFRSYNLILDRAAARDDLEALVLVHQDTELTDPELLRQGPRGARRSGRRRSSAASEPRRAQPRVVGGLRDVGLVHPPLRGARRRRPAGLRVDAGRRARVRPHRRGRRRRRLPARALAVGGAQAALRRVAWHAARLRRRPLPAGARRRAQGGDRGLPRDPQPLARARQRHRGLGRGAHAPGREVERAHRRRSRGRQDWKRAGAAGRGRGRGRARGRRLAAAPLRRPRAPVRATRGDAREHRLAHHGAAAARQQAAPEAQAAWRRRR